MNGSGVFDPAQRVGRTPPRPAPVTIGGVRLPAVGTTSIYVCGITPYDVTHLGHAATFVWADVLASVLEHVGVTPRSVRNVTDIDDVLTRAALDRGTYYDELALMQESVFEHSMRSLRVATPAQQPRARHHVTAVQQLAQALLDRGAAYERDGTVWFRGEGVEARAGLDSDDAAAVVAAYADTGHGDGDHPLDVAVWRPSGPEDPAWPSPWGWGRPGWHAECAAMALACHGSSVDVLVGGDDLAFPHHAYQAALVEAATGVTPFTLAHLHVGAVRLNGERMAKSTGNLVLVDSVLEDTSPALLRMALVDRPHGEPWDFDALDRAATAARLDALYDAAASGTAAAGAPGDADRVLAPLRDGLDVPAAVDAALEVGGEGARRLIALLRLA